MPEKQIHDLRIFLKRERKFKKEIFKVKKSMGGDSSADSSKETVNRIYEILAKADFDKIEKEGALSGERGSLKNGGINGV